MRINCTTLWHIILFTAGMTRTGTAQPVESETAETESESESESESERLGGRGSNGRKPSRGKRAAAAVSVTRVSKVRKSSGGKRVASPSNDERLGFVAAPLCVATAAATAAATTLTAAATTDGGQRKRDAPSATTEGPKKKSAASAPPPAGPRSSGRVRVPAKLRAMDAGTEPAVVRSEKKVLAQKSVVPKVQVGDQYLFPKTMWNVKDHPVGEPANVTKFLCEIVGKKSREFVVEFFSNVPGAKRTHHVFPKEQFLQKTIERPRDVMTDEKWMALLCHPNSPYRTH